MSPIPGGGENIVLFLIEHLNSKLPKHIHMPQTVFKICTYCLLKYRNIKYYLGTFNYRL